MSRLRVALAQVNAVVGDLDGNTDLVVAAVEEAAHHRCDLVVFPELVLAGYPPEDLLLRPAFVDGVAAALRRAAEATGPHPGLVAVIGFVERDGDHLHNAAAICAEGRVRGVYRKRLLPNYAVFDEDRYFEPGNESPLLWGIAGVSVGVAICEDAWADDGPLVNLALGGAEVMVLLNASPFHAGKRLEREHTISRRAVETGCDQIYVNLVGGQDELIFDGGSFIVDRTGQVVHRSSSFVAGIAVVDLDIAAGASPAVALPVVELTDHTAAASESLLAPQAAPMLTEVEEVYAALVVGLRDYVNKNGFGDVVVGLSGGIDSSLVATIAADALGPDRVHGVALPSRYSSAHSHADAEELATRLGIDMRTIPIEAGHAALLGMLGPSFVGDDGMPVDDADLGLTGENLQSRIRAVAIMALSNRFGWLVLTTSNKSESAVGYSTLYGDSAGGLAVIKDVPKLLVYRLCRHRNEVAAAAGEVPPIPVAVLDKPPSAELRPGQRDDQSLPPYEILDPLLEAYVEGDRSVAELIADGHDPALVARVVRLVDAAEFKRRQSPPGLRVTTKAFGKDRRLPITNAYRG